jgi:flagellar basal body-associated protein FliL
MEAKAETSKKTRFKGRVLLPVLVFLLIPGLVWIGYSFVEKRERRGVRFPIRLEAPIRNCMVNFADFLIPLGVKSRHTMISLSFSLQLPNGELEKAVEGRMNELRGMIYDTLREEFGNWEGIPSVQAVKDGIGRAMALALPGIQVKEIYIGRFLAL